jgi:hypothetical protein
VLNAGPEGPLSTEHPNHRAFFSAAQPGDLSVCVRRRETNRQRRSLRKASGVIARGAELIRRRGDSPVISTNTISGMGRLSPVGCIRDLFPRTTIRVGRCLWRVAPRTMSCRTTRLGDHWIRERWYRGVPGVLRASIVSEDGKVNVGGSLDAGSPLSGKDRQAKFPLSKGTKWC